MKKVTIADVAEAAGVSKTTVSRYLKQENVKSDIAKKVQTAIVETGYVVKGTKQKEEEKPKVVKQQKKVINRNYKFAVLTTDFTKSRTRKIVKALEDIWHQEGCIYQICNTQGDRELEKKYLSFIMEHNVHAILVESCNDASAINEQMSNLHIPVIYLSDLLEGACTLSFDEIKAGELLAHYMMEKQNLIIRYLSVDEKLSDARIKGMKDSYLQKKQPIDFVRKIAENTYTDIFEKIKEIFSQRIDLLLLDSDEMAIPLGKFIKDYHIAIPQNVSVISFGGHEVAKLMSPSLACVSYDYDAYAEWIHASICAKLEGKAAVKKPNLVTFYSGESIR